MYRIELHRRAEKYLLKMPRDRQIQVIAALEDIANLVHPDQHPNAKTLAGNYAKWFRLRIGLYRAIFQPREENGEKVLYVDFIGPRGDSY
jgi:mRNA-degrading endonuclease RelE of RelBE toxin-antitoxin system